MRDFLLDDYNEKSDDELVVITSILSQINLIKNRFYIPDDFCIIIYYFDLRKRILARLKACNDNQQNTLLKEDMQKYFHTYMCNYI